MPKSKSFTIKANGRLRSLQTSCVVYEAFDPASPPNPAPAGQTVKGLWDTGASQTAITQALVDKLGLVPTGMTNMSTAAGLHQTETYVINIMLPNGVGFPGVVVSRAVLHAGIDVLVGMDIIGRGDFAITNFDGKTVWSYRFPSSKSIDFVQEHQSDAVHEKKMSLIKDRPKAQKHRARQKTGKRRKK